jgi:phage terminase small subunit
MGSRRNRPGRESATATQSGLTPAQYTFCLAYLENGFNATQAYLIAHPNAGGATARTEGARTLAKPDIREYLSDKLEAAWERLRMGGDEALARIAMIAREAPDDRVKLAALKVILEQTGKLKPSSQGVDALAEALRQDYKAHGVLMD